MLTRNPSSVDQFDQQTEGNHVTMVHPWPHNDAQDPQGLAKGDCWLRLFGETRPRRGWSKNAGGTPWKSLSSIVGTKRVVSCKLSSKTFCGRKTPHGTNVSLVKFKSSTSELHCFPNMLGQLHPVTLFTIAHQGALVRGSPTRTCQFSESAWWNQP